MRKVEILISIQTNPHYALASKEMLEEFYRDPETRIHKSVFQ